MAEKLFSHQLALHGDLENYQVASAGTWTKAGFPADPTVARMLQERYGLTLKDHRSKEINSEMISNKDLILVMEKNHREALQIEFPSKFDQIFLLSEMIGQEFDITDPHHRSEQEYEMAVQQIHQLIQYGYDEILKRVRTHE
jgi:protein-tyrosine phosphatase